MGKKNYCKKSSTSTCCDSTSSSSSCFVASKSSTYGYCCTKYPRCKCGENKCAPIYYPNNCVGQYPCNPCPPPCPLPCPPPCPPFPCYPAQCKPTYNSYPTIITGSPISTTLQSQYTLYIVNPTDTSGNLNLPLISSLNACCYNKMFVISNISSNTITLNPYAPDVINGQSNSITIGANSSITLFSSYISGLGYWSLIGTNPV